MAKEKTKKNLPPITDEVGKRLPDKDYKSPKPKYVRKWCLCPFCGEELPEVTNKTLIEEWVPQRGGISRLFRFFRYPSRAKKCLNVGLEKGTMGVQLVREERGLIKRRWNTGTRLYMVVGSLGRS